MTVKPIPEYNLEIRYVDENDKKVIYNELLQFDHRKYLNMTLEDREDANKLNNFVNYIENILKEKTVNSNVLKI